MQALGLIARIVKDAKQYNEGVAIPHALFNEAVNVYKKTVTDEVDPLVEIASGYLTDVVGLQGIQSYVVAATLYAAYKKYTNITNEKERQSSFISFLLTCAIASEGFQQTGANLDFNNLEDLLAAHPEIKLLGNVESLKKLLNNPVLVANMIYAGQGGNLGASSGDGWNFRPVGYIKISGRSNIQEYAVQRSDHANVTSDHFQGLQFLADISAYVMFKKIPMHYLSRSSLDEYFSNIKRIKMNNILEEVLEIKNYEEDEVLKEFIDTSLTYFHDFLVQKGLTNE